METNLIYEMIKHGDEDHRAWLLEKSKEVKKALGMTLNEYQNAAQEFAVYPQSEGVMYTALALNEEAGEYAGKIAKAVRKRASPDFEAAAKELGDTLWQLSQAAREIGYTLEDVALMNLDKLYERKVRGTIIGSGDER